MTIEVSLRGRYKPDLQKPFITFFSEAEDIRVPSPRWFYIHYNPVILWVTVIATETTLMFWLNPDEISNQISHGHLQYVHIS